jgi:arsenite-transporting ATPase
LLRSGDELTVQAGNWRRNLVLPRSLRGLEIGQARFSDHMLNIVFEKRSVEAMDE